jgi:ComF family protein
VKQILKTLASGISGIAFPRVCEVCGTSLTGNEDIMCLDCQLSLPVTNIHNDDFNTIHERLMGHARINRAGSYIYYYRNGAYSRLIHTAKYRNRPIIAEKLARQYASILLNDNFFDDIDVIIPVPMYRLKRLWRGYNQAESIARGISEVTGIPVSDNLVATRHGTQTRRGQYDRWINAMNTYHVEHAEELDGLNILIVDDVITTGATMLACCEAINRACSGVTLNIVSLGVTHLR